MDRELTYYWIPTDVEDPYLSHSGVHLRNHENGTHLSLKPVFLREWHFINETYSPQYNKHFPLIPHRYEQYETVKIISKGDIQGVGYREHVRNATFRKNISGYVQYLESDDVEIIAEVEDNELTKFIEDINVSEYPIDVHNINVTWQESTGEFKKFEIIPGNKDQRLFELIYVAVTRLCRALENTSMNQEK